MCLNLPSQQIRLPDGKTPMEKPSRVDRKREKIAKKAAEDELIQGKRVDSGYISPELRLAVLVRDEHRCQLCGATIDTLDSDGNPTVLEVDHVFPHSRGGPTTLDNLQVACKGCNRAKKAKAIPARKRKRKGGAPAPAPREQVMDNQTLVQKLGELVGKKQQQSASREE